MDHTIISTMSQVAKPQEVNKLEKWNKTETFPYKINIISKNDNEDHQPMLDGSPSYMEAAVDLGKLMATSDEAVEVSPPPCGGQRVKKYWAELSSTRVFIPERWNQEELLMDWIDYSSFDSLLAPKGIDSARKALIAEAQRAHQQEEKV
ncbi:hypothetical protein LIER_05734 [Lithospermum erythrorhizon]|uniref:Uncharacterized protein n=1 Tax=Lithospermum erythrorhizon TaxID=34254 RepID=A0AAV3P260_LITER